MKECLRELANGLLWEIINTKFHQSPQTLIHSFLQLTFLMKIFFILIIPFTLLVGFFAYAKITQPETQNNPITYTNKTLGIALSLPWKAAYREYDNEVEICYKDDQFNIHDICDDMPAGDDIFIKTYPDLEKKVKLTGNLFDDIATAYNLKKSDIIYSGWFIEDYHFISMEKIGDTMFFKFTTKGVTEKPMGNTVPEVTFYAYIKGNRLYNFKFFGFRTSDHIKTFMENVHFL